MSELILFIVAALPVVLVGKYIYNKDKNKESSTILIKLFLGGILSCFLTLLISGIMGVLFPIFDAEIESLNWSELIIYVFIGVALVEEISKWVMVYFFSYNNHEFDEIYDMIVYGAFVALGFAFFENLLYVFYNGGISTGIVRAISAIPGHACDGVFMGYYLGLAKISAINNRQDLKKKNLILSILIPTILHGIYDYCLMVGNVLFILLFLIFVILLYKRVLRKINRVSMIDKKIQYKDKFCPNCGLKVDSNFCTRCGRKHE